MSFLRFGTGLSCALRSTRPRRVLPIAHSPVISFPCRSFHAAPSLWGVKSQVLKDVGEGMPLASTVFGRPLKLFPLPLLFAQSLTGQSF